MKTPAPEVRRAPSTPGDLRSPGRSGRSGAERGDHGGNGANGGNGHRRTTEQPLSGDGFRDELKRVADAYVDGEAAFDERRARLPDTLRALATVLREAVTVLARLGLPAEIDRLPSPRPLDRGLVLRVAGMARGPDDVDAVSEQPAQLRIEVRSDARLQIVWVGHAGVSELPHELHRDQPRAPSELGILGFKREVVRFLDAARASSYRAG